MAVLDMLWFSSGPYPSTCLLWRPEGILLSRVVAMYNKIALTIALVLLYICCALASLLVIELTLQTAYLGPNLPIITHCIMLGKVFCYMKLARVS